MTTQQKLKALKDEELKVLDNIREKQDIRHEMYKAWFYDKDNREMYDRVIDEMDREIRHLKHVLAYIRRRTKDEKRKVTEQRATTVCFMDAYELDIEKLTKGEIHGIRL